MDSGQMLCIPYWLAALIVSTLSGVITVLYRRNVALNDRLEKRLDDLLKAAGIAAVGSTTRSGE